MNNAESTERNRDCEEKLSVFFCFKQYKMKKFLTTAVFILMLTFAAEAQDFSIKIGGDSTFNAAEDKAKTFEGFDVDTSKLNVLNIGMMVVEDFAGAKANEDVIVKSLNKRSYYRQRADLLTAAALPGRTNMYFTVSFMQEAEGVKNAASVVVTNLEIEHYFKKNIKFRFGRLANGISESQFFGRIALEETSSHVYGRKIFINDAFEFDGAFSKNGPKYFIGVKPVFSPLNIKGGYAGINIPFKNGFKMHYIAAVYRNFDSDSVSKKVYFDEKEAYFSWEAEFAQRWKKATVYLNMGSNAGYKGLYPHTSGAFDFLKQMKPVVTRRGDAFNETFMGSFGARIFPAKMSPKWNFLQQVGVETEFLGLLSDNFSAVNICAYMKMNITKRLVLTYYCTPEFIDQTLNANKPQKVNGVVNFVRFSLTVGNPGRMYM